MFFKTPHYWYRNTAAEAPLPELALGLAAPLYQWAHRLNQSMTPAKKSPVPVICVGNAVAGGSGKTPVALALMDLVRKHMIAQNPFFLSRGFGGTLNTPTLVDYTRHQYTDCGDEALLLAAAAPTIVARKRIDGAELAALEGGDLVIMDDGLQHGGLIKDISFLVIDGQAGFGNLKTLPAGPLREPLAEALAKTDAVILVGKDKRGVTHLIPDHIPVFHALVEADEAALPPKEKIVAFAGLGRPEKFYNFLLDLGYDIAGWHPFADHHPYSDADLDMLEAEAMDKGAILVTTEKDYMRLKGHAKAPHIRHIPIRTVIAQEADLTGFLKDKLQ